MLCDLLKRLHLDFTSLRFYKDGQTLYFHDMENPHRQTIVGFGGGSGNNIPESESDYVAYCGAVVEFLKNYERSY